MPVFDFPNTPAVGDIFTDPTSGAAYTWNGYAWMGGSGGSLGALVVQDAPPTSPADNSLWYESDTGMLFLRYNDGNSSQWVQLNALPSGAGYATIPYANSLAINSNRIINGDMRYDQRNNGASGTATGNICDRWKYSGGAANKGTWQRGASGPAALAIGFPYFLSFTSSSAYTAAATEAFIFYQPIEADMISDFAWGTPGAQTVTLSFWVTSSLTGTFGGVLKNTVPDRAYPFTYSIPVASTWTKISVTVPGDTGGNWTLTGNTAAIYVQFDLGSGANFRAPAGLWQAGNLCGVNGTVSVVSTNAATFFITGVKLELGPLATPYPQESLAKKFADCQRYYQVGQMAFQGYATAASNVYIAQSFPVQMRAVPAMATTANNSSNVGTLTYVGLGGAMGTTLLAVVTATGGYVLNANYTANAEL